jgi:putative ABC transport system permease protein
MALTFVGIHAFRLLGPTGFPRLEEISVDAPVLAFCLLLSLVSGLLSGLVPAVIVSRRVPSSGLGSRVEGGGALRRGQGVFIAGELAAAVVLLAGSGLLATSALRLQGMDPGIDPDDVILMQVSLPPTYAEGPPRVAFLDSLRERLAALPGVASASYVEDPPMGFNTWSPPIRAFEDARVFEGAAHRVGEDYFRTMGIRLLSGRLLTRGDDSAARVVVLSKELAEQIWPGENALGRRIRMDDGPEAPWYTVVGVVNGIRQYGLDQAPAGEAYLPAARGGIANRTYLAVKTGADPARLTGHLRQAVWSLDPNVPIPEITTMKSRVDATLRLPRFRALLLSLFTLLALVLVSAGVWGMVRYVVSRRTREIGIHMALGAQPGEVAARLFRQVLWPILGGAGVGLAGAFAATRLLDSVLFGVEVADPGTLLPSAAALATLGVLSALFPIRRATRVNPADVLRTTP